MTLDFSASGNRPKINAIEIIPVTSAARRELAEELELEVPPANALSVSPNPFSDRITVSFVVEEDQTISLQVYDLQGRALKTLFQGEVKAGELKQVEFDGTRLPAGIYLTKLLTLQGTRVRKVVLSK